MTIVTIKCRNINDGEHTFDYDTEIGIVIGTAMFVADVISRQKSDDKLGIPTEGIYIVACPICGTENRVIIS